MARPRRTRGAPKTETDTRYEPDWYDLIHASDEADVGFYTDLARDAGGPVLEVGIGSGRIALPIARAGVAVHGIDKSDAMLAGLQRKLDAERGLPIRYDMADMRDFDLGRRFPLVIVPFRAFLHNLTTADQVACLKACRRHLARGGELVFNVFHPSLAYMAANTGSTDAVWRWIRDVEQPDGGWVSLAQATRYDPVAQHVHARQRIDRFLPDGRLDGTFELRIQIAYLYPGDLHHILLEAGFTDRRIETGFSGGAFERDGDELVVRARV